MTLTSSRNGVATVNDPVAAPLAELQGYLDLFLTLQEALSAAAILFRDTLYLNAADCNEIVQTLRDLRRVSTECHQFWLVTGSAGQLHALSRPTFSSVQNVHNVFFHRLFDTSLTDYLDCNRERSRRSQPTCILNQSACLTMTKHAVASHYRVPCLSNGKG